MRTEDFLMYMSSCLLLLLIVILFRKQKGLAYLNIAIALIYSSILYYNFFFHSDGGSGLLWMFYIVVVTWIHIVIIWVVKVGRYFRRKK